MGRSLSPFQRWLCTRTVPAPDHIETVRDLYRDFEEWCGDHAIAPLARRAFMSRLSEASIPPTVRKRIAAETLFACRGVALKPRSDNPSHGTTGRDVTLIMIVVALILCVCATLDSPPW